ncbi:exodeoxyribonuclease V subunit alpha [Marinicella litoralis]|uniref:RecBCD enzyme subunit RecD n=1 Tax=Marinicella litoralis TaxID=644220 RepID=A0A4R6XKP3_9GAMM|nr:exodeoxyribonuclease V subunit alpha [Marinicella litoralis]TDR18474.1 DNA helicase/exodeoxyribonuclease V alpha subunit [Marinicella litoralis]
MRYQVTAQHLAHIFPELTLKHERLLNQLNLDLGHLQLLRDGYQAWDSQDQRFWLLLLALVDAVNQGSLCLDLNHPTVNHHLQTIGLTQGLALATTQDWQQFKLNQQPVIKFEQGCLYFTKYWQLETQLQLALKRLLRQYTGVRFTAVQVATAAQQVTGELSFEQIEDKQVLAIVVSLLQPFSIISGGPGTGKTTIMSSVLRGLMLLGYEAKDVCLAAPTGRAANRMTESLHEVLSHRIKVPAVTDAELISIEATTIHRLLGARAQWRGFQYGEHNPLDCKVLVVDEVSMVDVALMRQLLQAIPLGCRVILLGDQFQLPSVDSGAVLADLMPPVGSTGEYSSDMWQKLEVALTPFNCKAELMAELNTIESAFMLTDHVTVLDVSKRNQKDIAELSESVRLGDSDAMFKQLSLASIDTNGQVAGDMAAWNWVEQIGVYWLPTQTDNQAWQETYLQWIQWHYFKSAIQFKSIITELNDFDQSSLTTYHNQLDQLFAVINSNRILTLVNDTLVGSLHINAQIAEMMKQRLAVTGSENRFHGSVIMLGQNSPSLGLFNGDVAILLAANNGQLRAVLPNKSGYRSHSIHVLPRFTSAYAITVHKSQGSEFNHVLMPLPEDEQHRLLSREIIYTGLTRAKQSVGIYAQRSTLETAVKRQTTRYSGLRFWYNQEH